MICRVCWRQTIYWEEYCKEHSDARKEFEKSLKEKEGK